jgi:hypothetical protein
MHGGKTLVGVANGQYRTGRYSSYLPPRLAEKYHQALRDPELLSLRDEIAAVDARLAELWSRVDSGESGELFEAMDKEWGALKFAQDIGNIPKMHECFAKLDTLFGRKRTDVATHREIREQIEARRKLVETEQKRLVTSQQVLSATEAMVFRDVMTDIIIRHVTDKKVLSDMLVEIRQIANHEGVPVYGELTE